MNKFEEYEINVNTKDKKHITDYLKKINDFINERTLDTDLYFDIEERVFEKLSNEWNLDQLKIKQILNEIWEPEDIFELEESDKNTWFINIIKSLINTWKLTVQKIFATWFNIWNLLLLIKTILKNIFKLTKLIITKIFKITKAIIISTFNYLKITIIKLFWFSKIMASNALIILKKIFNFIWSFIGYIILFCSILLLFFVPLLYSGLELWNINFTNVIPHELLIAYSFLVLSIAILWIFFIIRKKLLIHFIFFWISTIFVLSFSFLGSTKIYNNYSFTWESEKTYILETKETNLFFWYNKLDLYWNVYIDKELYDDYSIDIFKSEDDKIRIKIKTDIFTQSENTFKEIESNLNEIIVKEENQNILIDVKNWETFINKTNFIPIFRTLEIYIPENKIIEFGRRVSYKNHVLYNCESWKFTKSDNKIICVVEPVFDDKVSLDTVENISNEIDDIINIEIEKDIYNEVK